MRLWHYELFPYLPDMQFRGQLRELCAIMRDVRDKGQTNHILINLITEYPREDLYGYYLDYSAEYIKRYGTLPRQDSEFVALRCSGLKIFPFEGWHDKEYLRVCMANLYEKHVFGRGKSRITDEEWKTLVEGYRKITGEDYQI